MTQSQRFQRAERSGCGIHRALLLDVMADKGTSEIGWDTRPARYPALLATAGLNDPRVPYWEPAKWVAKLRSMKTDTNPLYIKINMAGGHGGSSGRYDVLRERAFRYAFMLDAVGMAQ